MTKPDDRCLAEIASEQAGYFTSTQARGCGYSWALLSHHAGTGTFVRARRGLYRFRDHPSSPHEEVMAAWLAAGPGAVVSHESALDIYGVSDVIPNRIHITVPRTRRGSRRPGGVALHTPEQAPGPEEVLVRFGMRVTAPVRTMLDVTRAGLGPDHVARAVTQMINRGLTTAKELKDAANLHGGRVSRTISDSLASAQ